MTAPKRVFLACDVSNLWSSCRDQFGKRARVDFQLLSEVVPSLFPNEQVELAMVAYMVTGIGKKHSTFIRVLEGIGYEVQKRFMVQERGSHLRTDWGIGMAIDAIDRMDEYDLYALASGDGDFSMLLDYLNQMGKETMVLSFRNSLSSFLMRAADNVYYLNSNIILSDPMEDSLDRDFV